MPDKRIVLKLASTMDFRPFILEQLTKGSVTRYRLAQRLRSKVPQRTLYDYLAGKRDTSTEVLGAIFEVLEVSVVPKAGADFRFHWRQWEKDQPDAKRLYWTKAPSPKPE